MGDTLGLERLDGGHAGVHRVAIVCTAAAVQLAVVDLGGPGAEIAAPAGELGLLVEVAVHEHGLARCGRGRAVLPRTGRDLEEQHRRARLPGRIVQAKDLELQTRHLLRLHPVGCALQDPVQQTMLGPIGIKSRRLGGHLDVALQFGHDALGPGFVHMGLQGLGLQGQNVGGQAGVHGSGLPSVVAQTARASSIGSQSAAGRCLRRTWRARHRRAPATPIVRRGWAAQRSVETPEPLR